jgi:hypothetical protein
MSRTATAVVRTPDEITEDWLGGVLGAPVAALTTTRIGTGQMSESHRVEPTYAAGPDAGPASVVVKLAASDPTSRATGIGLGIYEREVRFYEELAPRIGGPLAGCLASAFDAAEGWFTLVLEDIAPARQGDQIAGCGVDEAALAMEGLARLHAPVLADPVLGATPWLNESSPVNQAFLSQLLPGFLERYGDCVAPEHRALCERFVASSDAWMTDRQPPLGLVHGDYRLDNLLFGEARSLTVVDWQTVGWGPVMLDASYFLGGGLTVEDRRRHEEELVRLYHDALGAEGFSWEACWAGYRRQAFHNVLMAIVASMLVERTPRGDDMFMATLARGAQQALDLDAVELLAAPGSGRPAPLRPEPADEGRHPPGPDELWNESWYFDAVTEDGSLGAWVRLGLYPNLGVSWVTAFVCGPGRPAVAIIDFAAPLPEDGGLAVATGRWRADHVCEAPLERFRVTLAGTGERFDDPSAPLRGEAGAPVEVALDAVWETLGEPYAYRMATRYEIPCRVDGTVRVGDEELVLRGVGQRDHSWGTRDWWAMDWVWSAGHLDDGTRFHAVELRLPDGPRIGVGYVQPPDGELLELDAVRASEEVGDDGLIRSARLGLDPVGIELSVEPLGWGPLLLTAPDGRTSSFPRAMCRVRASDGRAGWAWLEWNRNSA